MYVDTEKSTPDKYYIYDYMIWGSTESTPIQPRLHIYTYPVTLGELQEINETDTEKRDQIEVTEDYVDLPQCENVPMQSLNQDDTWICSYSPISMSINMSAQAPEEEAQDPYCIKYIELKYKYGTNYIIFKQDELDNTGYTCGDLFLQRTLQQGALDALQTVLDAGRELDVVALVGLPLLVRGKLYNCAAVLCGGRLLGLVPKTYLPNYGEFYEKRQFTPGSTEVENVTDRKSVV